MIGKHQMRIFFNNLSYLLSESLKPSLNIKQSYTIQQYFVSIISFSIISSTLIKVQYKVQYIFITLHP